jgi:hypothetical protein
MQRADVKDKLTKQTSRKVGTRNSSVRLFLSVCLALYSLSCSFGGTVVVVVRRCGLVETHFILMHAC